MKLYRSRGSHGFSLVELLIAVAVFAVALTVLIGLFTQSFQGVFSAGRKTEAQYMGQEAMENVLAGIENEYPDAIIVVEPEEDISLEIAFTPPITLYGTMVTVTVNYTDSAGRSRTQVFKSFIPKTTTPD